MLSKISQITLAIALLLGTCSADQKKWKPGKSSDENSACTQNCRKEMADRQLETVADSYKYLRRCFAEKCNIAYEPVKPSRKTCVFLCEANTHQQGLANPADYENYLNDCYASKCKIQVSSSTQKYKG